MKKLMFGLAIAAVGTAFAVESSNVVGYNNTAVGEYETWQFIGASFEAVGNSTFLPLSSLACEEGISDGDQIQTSSVDQNGIIQFKTYEFWDGEGWADPESSEIIGDDVGLELGKGAWFVSSEPKHLTTSGQVKKSVHIHTFEEAWSINSGAFPTSFCPNSANVSWGVSDGDQIQTSSVDENGIIQFKTYEYWDGEGWADPESSEILDPGFAVATAGKGFWIVLNNTNPEDASFTEVSPIGE